MNFPLINSAIQKTSHDTSDQNFNERMKISVGGTVVLVSKSYAWVWGFKFPSLNHTFY